MPAVAADSLPLPKPKKAGPKYPLWEYPKGSGIKIAEMPNKTGGEVYGVSYQVRIPGELLGIPNGRQLLQRATKAEAERLAEDRFLSLRKHGTEFAKVPADAQRALAAAWGVLADHNKSGGKVLTIGDVMAAGIRQLARDRKKLAEVFAELRASKAQRLKDGGLDASTERDFRSRTLTLERYLGDEFTDSVTPKQIEDALKQLASDKSLTKRSVLNYRNTLAESFRHAKSQGYCDQSPMERFTREAYKSLGGEKAERNLDAINILTIDETRRVLKAAQAHGAAGMLATVILRLFCGLRTKEVCRLDWKEVHWLDPKPYVHVPQGKAKKRNIRHVDIPENALAWLKLCNPPAEGKIDPFSYKTYAKRFGRIAKQAGIGAFDDEGTWESEWENNDTRHSYGSYLYALNGDAIKTARLMGHRQDDDVLFAHYRSLVREEEGAKFFAIFPETDAGNVTEFPRAATSSGGEDELSESEIAVIESLAEEGKRRREAGVPWPRLGGA